MTSRSNQPSGLLAVVLVTLVGLAAIGCSDGNAATGAKPPATPDEAVTRTARELADGHPETIWHALPTGYQRDVTELVHESAAKMDPELWNRTFEVLGKLTRLLSEKRRFILDHPMLAQKLEDRAEAEANWDAVVGLVDVLVHSELADLDKVRRLDVEAFLAGTGTRFMERMAAVSALTPEDKWADGMEQLRATTATVVSASGDQAVLRVERPSATAREKPYVRVEGKWIPKDMAEEWPPKIEEARASLAKFSTEEMQENKPAMMMQLGMLDGALDSLIAAETAEEFNAGLGAFMGMAVGTAMAQAEAESPPDAAPAPPGGNPQRSTAAPPNPSDVEPTGRARRTPYEPAGPREIPVEQAAQHVGRSVRLVTRDGTDTIGILKKVSGHVLTVEQELTGGTVSFEIDARDVESMTIEG